MAKYYRDEQTGAIVDETGRDVTEAYETGGLKAAMYGAGDVAHNIASRVVPEAVKDVPLWGPVLSQMGQPRTREDAQFIEDVRGAHPFSYGAGAMGAQMVGPTKGGMITQGLYGGLQGAMTADPGESTTGGITGAAGGVGGDMLGRVLGRAYNAFKNIGRQSIDPVAGELLESGYKLTPAQKTGKQGYMKIERQLEKTPKGQEITGAIGKHNEDQLLKRANQSIGLPAGSGPIDRNARELAHEGVVRKMAEAGQGVDLEVSPALAKRVSRIIRNDDMLEIPELPSGGTINGRDYMRIRTDLKKAHRGMDPGTGPETFTDKTIRMMDDEFMMAAGNDKSNLYRVAREHEKNLINLEKGAALSPDGYVNPKSLSNALKSKSGYGTRGVDNVLPETGALIKDVDNLSGRSVNPMIGDSGTTDASRNIFDWKQALQSAGAEKYYGGQMNMPGLLESADPRVPLLLGNVGRAGLLSLDE